MKALTIRIKSLSKIKLARKKLNSSRKSIKLLCKDLTRKIVSDIAQWKITKKLLSCKNWWFVTVNLETDFTTSLSKKGFLKSMKKSQNYNHRLCRSHNNRLLNCLNVQLTRVGDKHYKAEAAVGDKFTTNKMINHDKTLTKVLMVLSLKHLFSLQWMSTRWLNLLSVKTK